MLKFFRGGLRRVCCFDAKKSAFGRLSNITRIWFSPLPAKSQWIKPCCVLYLENEMKKETHIVKVLDGVLVVLYNKSRDKLIFVRQFRAAVYQAQLSRKQPITKGDVDLQKFPPELGITLELCAGQVDKDQSLKNIAREEILEECGYDVPTDSIQPIFHYRSGVGISSGAQALFYCEVCDEQRVSAGGGVDKEVIQVVELSLDEARELVKTGMTTNGGPALLVGVMWFLLNKAPKSS
ncbi:uridine diphosphate glucose pyrophosphatase NUDT14-like [Drosophila pseudoobscura]|uniref:Uridine diphosphate glucose pyrophosphatase NUDT14 n=1 Tax=Drosophila pseudoobscura pseudoobscura TaxID=46245 RepID=A0A6I8V2I1_DROPS|nr:uridine diphosphate glucose pyrophosphatase NUDT14 [Drosophila pseudoobscura]